jgi:hypothetical protein
MNPRSPVKRARNLMMKTLLLLLFALPLAAQTCDPSLWDHVYHRHRLKVMNSCITVSGKITYIRREADGDLHGRLLPDPQFRDLLNDVNLTVQKGNLVIEPMCTHPVKQKDAVNVCKGFKQTFPEFFVGAHVAVTGVLVLDSESRHGWVEIHPVTSMKRIR